MNIARVLVKRFVFPFSKTIGKFKPIKIVLTKGENYYWC